MLKPTIFREYDIRGIADAELLSPGIEQLGRGLGTYIRRHSGGNRVKLRRDCPTKAAPLRDPPLGGLLPPARAVTHPGVGPPPALHSSTHHLPSAGATTSTR